MRHDLNSIFFDVKKKRNDLNSMMFEFDMSDLEKIRHFLGAEVIENSNEICVSKKLCMWNLNKVWNG